MAWNADRFENTPPPVIEEWKYIPGHPHYVVRAGKLDCSARKHTVRQAKQCLRAQA